MVLDLGGSRARPGVPGQGGSRLLYEQVVAYVEKLVAERGLVPGDRLPTHAELAATVGVSLITVRRALDELERAGRVRRHQGLGTFVARPRIVTVPARSGSLLSTLSQGGAGPSADSIDTRILEIRRGLPSPDVASALRIRPDAPVWRLRRLRLIDAQPAVVETSIIPVSLVPDLDQLVSLPGGSLYDLLARECGLEDEYEEQYLEVVVTPTREERLLLGVPPRTHVVRIRGLSMDKSGTPFDCFEQLYRATDFAFAISGSTARQLFPTPDSQDWDVRALPSAPS
ncbi:MAG: GntR family transcriptional regulator [Actinomycetota bacterium]|nr:GntR family transcriptional regulator [Actinomycetota bacterium]